MFVGTDAGLYRRNSEGWTLLPVDADHQTRNIRALASAGHRLYVALGDKAVNKDFGFAISARMTHATHLSLYRSTDLGESWRRLDFQKTETESSSQNGMMIRIGPAVPGADQKGQGGPEDSETQPISGFKMVATDDSLFVMDDRYSYYSNDAGENWVTSEGK